MASLWPFEKGFGKKRNIWKLFIFLKFAISALKIWYIFHGQATHQTFSEPFGDIFRLRKSTNNSANKWFLKLHFTASSKSNRKLWLWGIIFGSKCWVQRTQLTSLKSVLNNSIWLQYLGSIDLFEAWFSLLKKELKYLSLDTNFLEPCQERKEDKKEDSLGPQPKKKLSLLQTSFVLV